MDLHRWCSCYLTSSPPSNFHGCSLCWDLNAQLLILALQNGPPPPIALFYQSNDALLGTTTSHLSWVANSQRPFNWSTAIWPLPPLDRTDSHFLKRSVFPCTRPTRMPLRLTLSRAIATNCLGLGSSFAMKLLLRARAAFFAELWRLPGEPLFKAWFLWSFLSFSIQVSSLKGKNKKGLEHSRTSCNSKRYLFGLFWTTARTC